MSSKHGQGSKGNGGTSKGEGKTSKGSKSKNIYKI